MTAPAPLTDQPPVPRSDRTPGRNQDGVLGNLVVMADGWLGDTVVFSIITSQWPAVPNELRRRLAVYR